MLYIEESGLLWACCSVSQLKRIPPHCLEDLRGVYSQLEVFTCSKSLSSLEVTHTHFTVFSFWITDPFVLEFEPVLLLQELLSLCGGDLSSALPWLELHTLNFSYNAIVCLDESLVRHAPALWFIYSLTFTFVFNVNHFFGHVLMWVTLPFLEFTECSEVSGS